MTTLIERALRSESIERPPIWFMRQAGRILPEYREVRSRVSFLELCGDSDLSLEVTLQPVDRFDLDAAIAFSDILPVVEAIGREVVFEKGHGPKILKPVRSRSDGADLIRPDVADALPVLPETIRKFRAARPNKPILGFAGAPFTLLCYLVEGGGSRNWTHTKTLLWTDPVFAKQLLEPLADVVGDYLQAQVDAGAAAVQIFDTWAGILGPEDWRKWAMESTARALSRVNGAPRVFYSRDCSPYLPWLKETGADVFSLDWRTDMKAARQMLGDAPVQGNLDPMALFAPPDEIRRRVHRVISDAGSRGHVFNLGHGVLPTTPLEGVQAMVDAVKSYRY